MLYKLRTFPRELKVYEYLNTRIKLSETETKHLYNLRKGYEGEVQFDCLTATIQSEFLILNDLLLQQNRNTFQIDTLIITPETVHLFEIKNFIGDYFYDSDRLYTRLPPQSEITNPLIQLSRSESLLRQVLQNHGCTLPIQAWIVFINPKFTLYQVPTNMPFIFPGQIERVLQRFQSIPNKLNNTHWKLADQLTSLHIHEAPFYLPPSYKIHELRKGIKCKNCGAFEISVKGIHSICNGCGEKELSEDLIMRNVNEFGMLFPEEIITTNIIFDWSGGTLPKRTIGRALKKHMSCKGVRQWSRYEF